MFQPCLFYPRVISQHDSFKERWFAGTHGDVGGGWPEPKAGLAKISLEWMYNEAERAGARLDPDKRAYFLGHSSEYSSVERRFFGQPARNGGGPSRVAKTPPSVLAGVNDPFADAWVWNLLDSCLAGAGRRMESDGVGRTGGGDGRSPSTRHSIHRSSRSWPRIPSIGLATSIPASSMVSDRSV